MTELPMLAPPAERSDPTDLPAPTAADAGRRYRVEGMDCAGCARTVERAVAALEGANEARVSFGNGLLVVAGPVPVAQLERTVSAAGYRLRPLHERGSPELRQPRWHGHSKALSTVAATLLLVAATVCSLTGAPGLIADGLYLLSMAVGGWFVLRTASLALWRRSLDMNVLMAMAALGAVGIGAYAEGAWVLVLFAIGTTLESFALDRSRRSVEALIDLTPARARVVEGEVERLVPVEEIAPGTIFAVRPGERVALDGVLAEGISSLDEAPITGESAPRDKLPGDELFAGSLNGCGALRVRSTRWAEASTLARIAELVEDAQGSRAPSERFVDRFARLYTPLVFAAALLVAIVPIGLGADADTWIYRALALLIVACPCSLVISIPVSVVSAIGGAARRGVLIKSGQALEDLARIRTVAFDKTGTLTLGRFRLVETLTLGGTDSGEALRLAASLEQRSEHPLAAAVVDAARERGLTLTEPDQFEALPGWGAQARLEGRRLWIGGARLGADRLSPAATAALRQLEARGRTAILLGEDRTTIAAFGLADTPRPQARAALEALRAHDVQRLTMLTGDNEQVAAALARDLDLDDWQAGLLPEAKLSRIRELADHDPVAMVGDGINDAPALAAADVGIAMGAAGTDAALAAADVALLSDELLRLPEAVAGSQRALGVMRQNVILSLAVKGVFVVLAPLGAITLVAAVAADMGTSLLVTLNGLRLLGRGRRAA